MIVLEEISKKYSTHSLFEDVSVSFTPNHRYGLTGPNGAGKSTMLAIIVGSIKPTSGKVSKPKNIGFLKQNVDQMGEYKVRDVVIMGNGKLWNALEKQNELYQSEITPKVSEILGNLEEIVSKEGGYSADSDAEILLKGMGVHPQDYEKKLSSLPLDFRFRVLLCQAIFGNPEALLLDEPTNFLDIQSIGWLEQYLYKYKGTLIVVSHDKHFLNTVCTDIADLDYNTVTKYPGNYDNMVKTKIHSRNVEEQSIKSQEKKIAKLKTFVSKFSAGTRASQVQSRLQEIKRIAPKPLEQTNIQAPFVRFAQPAIVSGQNIFKINNLSKSFGELTLYSNFSYEIYRNDRIAVVGNNGKGKTVLLKMIAEKLSPDSGTIEKGFNVSIGYFPQNHSELVDKTLDVTVLEWANQHITNTPEREIRSALGQLLFGSNDVDKKIKSLSGGETARLILALLVAKKYNTLILDEPNNHLDIETILALSNALQKYQGTVIFSSHNRDFINSIATRIILLKEKPFPYEGRLNEYLS